MDEAYLDMSDDYPGNVMSEFVAAGKPVIVARTFSKIYGMAGQRLGYGLMPADMAMDMRKTGRLSNVNYLGLVAGMASLEDTEHFEKMRATMIRGRQKLIAWQLISAVRLRPIRRAASSTWMSACRRKTSLRR